MLLRDNKIGCEIQLSFTTGTGMSIGVLELKVPVNFSCLIGGTVYTGTDHLTTFSRFGNNECYLLKSLRGFIVLTNESQYAEALAVLFNGDIVSSYVQIQVVTFTHVADVISNALASCC